MRLLCYCVMPNHWHLVLWPRADEYLSEYMRWLAVTHAKRWHAHYHSSGSGVLYQGRLQSFPIQEGGRFLTVCRYVAKNPLRANLVAWAEEWRWCSLWHRVQGRNVVSLDAWPVRPGKDWVAQVNRAETEAEWKAVRRSVVRGTPFGEGAWVQRTAERLCLDSTLRARGRPQKNTVKER